MIINFPLSISSHFVIFLLKRFPLLSTSVKQTFYLCLMSIRVMRNSFIPTKVVSYNVWITYWSCSGMHCLMLTSIGFWSKRKHYLWSAQKFYWINACFWKSFIGSSRFVSSIDVNVDPVLPTLGVPARVLFFLSQLDSIPPKSVVSLFWDSEIGWLRWVPWLLPFVLPNGGF